MFCFGADKCLTREKPRKSTQLQQATLFQFAKRQQPGAPACSPLPGATNAAVHVAVGTCGRDGILAESAAEPAMSPQQPDGGSPQQQSQPPPQQAGPQAPQANSASPFSPPVTSPRRSPRRTPRRRAEASHLQQEPGQAEQQKPQTRQQPQTQQQQHAQQRQRQQQGALLRCFPSCIVGRQFQGGAEVAEGQRAVIELEEGNPRDPNALLVLCASTRTPLGHLPRLVARHLAPLLRPGGAGPAAEAVVEAVVAESRADERSPVPVEVQVTVSAAPPAATEAAMGSASAVRSPRGGRARGTASGTGASPSKAAAGPLAAKAAAALDRAAAAAAEQLAAQPRATGEKLHENFLTLLAHVRQQDGNLLADDEEGRFIAAYEVRALLLVLSCLGAVHGGGRAWQPAWMDAWRGTLPWHPRQHPGNIPAPPPPPLPAFLPACLPCRRCLPHASASSCASSCARAPGSSWATSAMPRCRTQERRRGSWRQWVWHSGRQWAGPAAVAVAAAAAAAAVLLAAEPWGWKGQELWGAGVQGPRLGRVRWSGLSWQVCCP